MNGSMAGLIALATAALLVTLCVSEGGAWPENVPRYTRVPGHYAIRAGGDCYDVARRLLPQGTRQQHWLVAQEIAAINGVSAGTALPRGHRMRVPIYRRYRGAAGNYATVDIRTWHVCVLAGMRYGIRPSTLVGVRLHEGGNWPQPRSYFGCKPYGAYNLRAEAYKSASILARVCRRYGYCGWHLSRAEIERMGYYYKWGKWGGRAGHWAACVQTISRRAEGR